MTSLIKTDPNYFAVTSASAFTAMLPAILAAIQLLHGRDGGLRQIYEIFLCAAFLILLLGLFVRHQEKNVAFILDALGSLTLATIFAILVVKISLHPSTTGDGDEIVILIIPAIVLFLTHSYMALVRFQISD